MPKIQSWLGNLWEITQLWFIVFQSTIYLLPPPELLQHSGDSEGAVSTDTLFRGATDGVHMQRIESTCAQVKNNDAERVLT